MAFDDLVKQVAASLEREGSPHAVFGDAVQLEHHTIVPVAVVTSGGGAGAAPGATNATSASDHDHLAGGGGFAMMVRPVGFIHEEEGEVVFTPIHVDRRSWSLVNETGDAIRRLVSVGTRFVTSLFRRAEAQVEPRASVEGIASPS